MRGGRRWRRAVDLSVLRRADAAMLLRLLLIADLVVIALHVAHVVAGIPGDKTFDLGVDRSYGEMLGYLKLGAIGILCAVLARRRHAALFGAIAVSGFVILVEDALIVHERVGQALAGPVRAAAPAIANTGILAVQIGELVWLGAMSVALVALLVVTWLRADPDDRRAAAGILLCFVVVGALAVVVDTVHSVFDAGSLGDAIFTVLEDGGELVALTPAFAIAFGLVSHEGTAQISERRVLRAASLQ